MDSSWAIMILALLLNSKFDNNRINYLNQYKKYGDDENV